MSPLRVRLDGDTAEVPFTPDSLVDPLVLAVNNRVRCELADRRLLILGRSGGATVPLPAGLEMFWPAAVPPAGWLIEDGSAISRTTYSALFAVLGTSAGPGNGTTTFNLPNMRGRVAAGWDPAQPEFNGLLGTGGAKTHTLTVNEMPSHSHDVGLSTADDGTLDVRIVQEGSSTPWPGFRVPVEGTNGGARKAITDLRGAGAAHNNLPPYGVRNFIIKT